MLRRRRAIKRQKLKDARNQGDKKEENKQKSALRRYEYEMKKKYRKLKISNRYDKGKELYSKGKRMSAGTEYRFSIHQALVVTGGKRVGEVLWRKGKLPLNKARQLSGVIIAGGTIVNVADYVRKLSKNINLSTYYTH